MTTRRLSNTAAAGFITCKDCGGLHYGTGSKCPYLQPCVICGDDTLMACADCGIDSGGEKTVKVCVKPECRDAHEATQHAGPATDVASPQADGVKKDGR